LTKRHARVRLRCRDHSERADKVLLSAILPYAPNTAGANIN
jgi:hypothetical protein